jgi:hypothetical protein
MSERPPEVKTPFLLGLFLLICTGAYLFWLFMLGIMFLIARGTDEGGNAGEFAFLALCAVVPGAALFIFWNRVLRRPDE